jgi:hypothetical protein
VDEFLQATTRVDGAASVTNLDGRRATGTAAGRAWRRGAEERGDVEHGTVASWPGGNALGG